MTSSHDRVNGPEGFLADDFRQTVFATYKALNTPVSLGLWMCFKYGDYKALVSHPMPNPQHYQTASAFFDDYQAWNLLRKNEFLDTGIDKAAVALQKFKLSEVSCSLVGERLRTCKAFNEEGPPSRPERMHRILSRAKRKISQVLGPFSVEEFKDCLAWGPGATATIPRCRSTPADKILEGSISVTRAALRMSQVILGEDIFWARARGIPADAAFCYLPGEFQVVDSDKGQFVPKDARSDRFISMAPTANLFLQKGIGEMIRKRLRRSAQVFTSRGWERYASNFGPRATSFVSNIDEWVRLGANRSDSTGPSGDHRRITVNLRDQSNNAHMSYVASLGGTGLATLDLSAASDTISYDLVKSLLPGEWFAWLNQLRVAKTTIGSETFELAKFSAMGNGYTFELESLIFWALVSSISDVALVYGDDIICCSTDVTEVTEALSFCGFTLNREKSYSEGYFRESCGSHYFDGISVKPIFIEEDPSTSYQGYFALCNKLLRLASRRTMDYGFDPSVYGAWLRATRGYRGPYYSLYRGDDTLDVGVALPADDARIKLLRRVPRDPQKDANPTLAGFSLPGMHIIEDTFRCWYDDPAYSFTLRFSPSTPVSSGFTSVGKGEPVVRRFVHWV